MELISIGFSKNICGISAILDEKLNELKEHLNYKKNSRKVGNTIFLEYMLDENIDKHTERLEKVFKNCISNVLTDLIINLYQENILRKLIDNRCYYLKDREREEIYEQTMSIIKSNEELCLKDKQFYVNRKKRVLNNVKDFLEKNNKIILEGFVNFRLKFLITYMEKALEKSLEDFFIQKEYKEFIKILQYFVDAQQPRIDLVNVVINNEKNHQLYDKNKKIIKNDFLEEIAEVMSDNNMNYEDLLISSLITIAPKQVVIHVTDKSLEDMEVIKTIKNVFVNRVEMCQGCDLCSLQANIENQIEKK